RGTGPGALARVAAAGLGAAVRAGRHRRRTALGLARLAAGAAAGAGRRRPGALVPGRLFAAARRWGSRGDRGGDAGPGLLAQRAGAADHSSRPAAGLAAAVLAGGAGSRVGPVLPRPVGERAAAALLGAAGTAGAGDGPDEPGVAGHPVRGRLRLRTGGRGTA